MNTRLIICLLLLSGLAVFSCGRQNEAVNNANRENEKVLIEKTINASIGWAKNKDINLLYSVIDNDSSFLEVHPGPKVVKGFDEFRKAEDFWMNPDFKAIRYDISDLRINISQDGNIAWWFCILNDINEWKGEPASWENTRWTGIMEKRNGKWIIVQQHFSFAAR
jgi:ketosteroid isomerase-like protein